MNTSKFPWNAQLCFIDEDQAYFTTQPLADQWGDDWDDAPYQFNAGLPYDPQDAETWEIILVVWKGPWSPPALVAGDWSVEEINAKKAPWLSPETRTFPVFPAIWAGTSLREFVRMIHRGGGKIWLPAEYLLRMTIHEVQTVLGATPSEVVGSFAGEDSF